MTAAMERRKKNQTRDIATDYTTTTAGGGGLGAVLGGGVEGLLIGAFAALVILILVSQVTKSSK